MPRQPGNRKDPKQLDVYKRQVMELEWSASDILARLKAGLKNEDTRIEGSFSMDNMQACLLYTSRCV